MRTEYPPDIERLSVEGYLVRERAAEYKSDYVYGAVRAMSGGTVAHGAIASNVDVSLGSQLIDKPCRTLTSDVRVQADTDGLYVYPDLTIVCGEPQVLDDKSDVLLNPTVIVEVLSPSTEAYDRGLKSIRYRSIPSLRDYLLICQDRPLIEHFSRRSDEIWTVETIEGLEGVVNLPSIGCALPLERVYHKVELEAR